MNRRHFGMRSRVPVRMGGSIKMHAPVHRTDIANMLPMRPSNNVQPLPRAIPANVYSKGPVVMPKRKIQGMGSILDSVNLPNLSKTVKKPSNIKFSL
jgi:hypothetical protein